MIMTRYSSSSHGLRGALDGLSQLNDANARTNMAANARAQASMSKQITAPCEGLFLNIVPATTTHAVTPRVEIH